MAKFVSRSFRGVVYVFYWCAGCKEAHSVPALRWNWNGDTELPTLHPSVRHYVVNPETKQEETICHYHLKAGVVEYCGDCKHELKNQRVPLQEIPTDYGIPESD